MRQQRAALAHKGAEDSRERSDDMAWGEREEERKGSSGRKEGRKAARARNARKKLAAARGRGSVHGRSR